MLGGEGWTEQWLARLSPSNAATLSAHPGSAAAPAAAAVPAEALATAQISPASSTNPVLSHATAPPASTAASTSSSSSAVTFTQLLSGTCTPEAKRSVQFRDADGSTSTVTLQPARSNTGLSAVKRSSTLAPLMERDEEKSSNHATMEHASGVSQRPQTSPQAPEWLSSSNDSDARPLHGPASMPMPPTIHRACASQPAPAHHTRGAGGGSGGAAPAGGAFCRSGSRDSRELSRKLETVLLQDSELARKVQNSLRGVSSLAKETHELQIARDACGATCMNQYVMVKTLGRGSFGKVKLCLNTLDGQLYAIKMVSRTLLQKRLQRAGRGLRKRTPRASADLPRPLLAVAASSRSAVSLDLPRTPSPGSPAVLWPSAAPGSANQHCSRHHLAEQPATWTRGSASSTTRFSLDEGGSTAGLDSVMREVAVLKKLDHPHVVKLLEVIDPPAATYIILVMEYMEQGPVQTTCAQQSFAALEEAEALHYFRQVCMGLDYLHHHGVAHGDLKPENLLTSASGVLKIGDFGSSRILSDATASTKVSSTPAFQPPEAFDSRAPDDPVSADVWALGVCLYCFAFGRLPFQGSCALDVSNAITHEQVAFPATVRASSELKHLLVRMLAKSPLKRLALPEVMAHAWVTRGGTAPLPLWGCECAPGAPGAQPSEMEISSTEANAAIARPPALSLIRTHLVERHVAAGDFLFRRGEPATCLYMIMSGTVDMIRLVRRRRSTKPVNVDASNDDGSEFSFCAEADDSFTTQDGQASAQAEVAGVEAEAEAAAQHRGTKAEGLASHRQQQGGALARDPPDETEGNSSHKLSQQGSDGLLHLDRQMADTLKQRTKELLLGKQNDAMDFVLEVKGPGQVVGEISLDPTAQAPPPAQQQEAESPRCQQPPPPPQQQQHKRRRQQPPEQPSWQAEQQQQQPQPTQQEEEPPHLHTLSAQAHDDVVVLELSQEACLKGLLQQLGSTSLAAEDSGAWAQVSTTGNFATGGLGSYQSAAGAACASQGNLGTLQEQEDVSVEVIPMDLDAPALSGAHASSGTGFAAVRQSRPSSLSQGLGS